MWGKAAVLAMSALVLTGCGGGTTTATETVTVTSTVSQLQVTTVTETGPPPGPGQFINRDGTYAVGTDVMPGVYRSDGPMSAGACYWKRLASFDSSDIIDNERSEGPQVVEILASDRAFSTQNCRPWMLAQ